MQIKTLKLVSIHIKESPQAVPLAAASLKAQLDSVLSFRHRLAVSLSDYDVDDAPGFISNDLCKDAPDLIGFSVYLWNRRGVLETCRLIRATCPNVILFAGGAEATARPLDLLDSAPFDFVVKGEGEIVLTQALTRILEGETPDGIPGVFVKGAKTDPEKDRQPVLDLDTLPSPFLCGVLDPEKYAGLLWELSRGCPFKCGFCFESRGVAGVRQISPARLQKELTLFEEKKVTQVFVLDPTFNCDLKRAKNILRRILKTAPLIHFTFEIRAELLDAEIAELFAAVHCSLQVGLQSAHPDVLARVNRTLDVGRYTENIALLNLAGVIFGLDLIYGLPGDTLEGFKDSLNFALGLQPNHLDIFPLAVIPGTALYDQAQSFGLNCLKDAPYTLIDAPGFSSSDMDQAERLKKACDIFYNAGGAAGWLFMALETLEMAPADFLSEFADYLSSSPDSLNPSRADITRMQLSFVEKLFARHHKKRLFGVMADLITIHGALNRSLYAGPLSALVAGGVDENTVFGLSPGTICLTLNYDFEALMTVGELTFEAFLDTYRAQKTLLVIYNDCGVVKTEVLERDLGRLLGALTGADTLRQISARENINISKKIFDFLKHAVSEQMIFNKERA